MRLEPRLIEHDEGLSVGKREHRIAEFVPRRIFADEAAPTPVDEDAALDEERQVGILRMRRDALDEVAPASLAASKALYAALEGSFVASTHPSGSAARSSSSIVSGMPLEDVPTAG